MGKHAKRAHDGDLVDAAVKNARTSGICVGVDSPSDAQLRFEALKARIGLKEAARRECQLES